MSDARTRPDAARHWTLDPNVTYLNHGSFGACPRPVLDRQSELRAEMEREPVRFLDRRLEGLLDAARAALAGFIGADAAGLVFVPNATTGVNTVLSSLAGSLRPGDDLLITDHEYNACRNAAAAVAAASGARVVSARVPFPLASPDEAVEAILTAATPRTRLALVSHVTSPTGLVLPIERVAAGLAERGVEVLIDGAHAPGMVPLALDDLAAAGVGYYTGNCHKWLSAPKGSGFLWARSDRRPTLRPVVVSHAANSPRGERSRFLQAFDWIGTADPTPYLAVPAAIDFPGRLLPGGWVELMAANRRLALTARDLLCRRLGIAVPAPDEMIGAMAALPLPGGIDPPLPELPEEAAPGTAYPEDPLNDVLYERFGLEVPVTAWPGVPVDYRPRSRLLRVSAQAYNSAADYERLADALDELRH